MEVTEAVQYLSRGTYVSVFLIDAGVHDVPTGIIVHDNHRLWRLRKFEYLHHVGLFGDQDYDRGAHICHQHTYMRVVSHNGELSPYAYEPSRINCLILPLVGGRLEAFGREVFLARLDDPVNLTKLADSNSFIVVVARLFSESLSLTRRCRP